MRAASLAALLLAASFAVAQPAPPTVGARGKPAEDGCTRCHAVLEDERLNAPALAAGHDIHHAVGVGCAGCHGGDPTSDDPEVAMDPKRGFAGSFGAQAIPDLCARCHSDPGFMLPYAPNIPTSQREQYRTSRHGKALEKGDLKVAVCTSCHGIHGMYPVKDPRAKVYPTRLVETCARCHADKALMSGYGISGDEVAQYRSSVHHEALTRKNDLSAPTCKTCHGAHGATPPGLTSVTDVCGTCHSTQREGFDASPHRDAFQSMGEPACEACHGNHAITHPEDRWLGVGEGSVCGRCHSEGDVQAKVADELRGAVTGAAARLDGARARVGAASRAGMLMDEAEVKLDEGNEALVVARVEIHTVSPAVVSKSTSKALDASAAAEKLTAEAEAELRYRRGGLFAALAIIALAAAALVAKIRQLES
ncbi:MAG: cytochrome c3 family protein [Myxococcaceae bacterium]